MPDEIAETPKQPEGDVPSDPPAEQAVEVEASPSESPSAAAPAAVEAAPPAPLPEPAQKAAEAAGELPQPLQDHIVAQVQDGGLTRQNEGREAVKLADIFGHSVDAVRSFVRGVLHDQQAGR